MKSAEKNTNWARVWRRWQIASTEIWIQFMVNIIGIIFYSLLAYVEFRIVTSFTESIIYVFVVWIGTLLALGNSILRRLKYLPEDTWLEIKNNKETLSITKEDEEQD